MKVVLVNGSPHMDGCTNEALKIISIELAKHGVDSEIIQVGKEPIRGCTGCNHCRTSKEFKCIFSEDSVNMVIDKINEADGLIIGSPVHYASASGAVTSFFDRVFYAGSVNFSYKPCASIVSCRRGGATAALDQLNKYFSISNMPVVSSNYWNMVHGNRPEEVHKDEEGVQTMRVLAKNMAWLLKCIECGKNNGIASPETVEKIKTNYIR